MSDAPTSVRNIPADALLIAQAISRRSELSVADVLRLALISGTLIELIKAGPGTDGLYAGFDEMYLAKSLRRQLAAPIDFLLEQGQHPYQGAFTASTEAGAAAGNWSTAQVPQEPAMMFDSALVDELDDLGLGGGLGASLIVDMNGMQEPVLQ